MLNFMIVVDDGGSLETVSRHELAQADDLVEQIEFHLNKVLDARAVLSGEYTPEDNDTPIFVTAGEESDD